LIKKPQNKIDTLSLIKKTNDIFVGVLDFQELAQKAVNLLPKDLGIESCTIFSYDKKRERLIQKAMSYAKIPRDSQTLLEKFLKNEIPIECSENYSVRAVKEKKLLYSHNLHNFTKPNLNEKESTSLQKIYRIKITAAVPILTKDGIAGAIGFGISKEALSDKEKKAIWLFADQVGLAMSNVLAHKNIVRRYEESIVPKSAKPKPEPLFRFTLRLTDDIEQYLAWKTNNSKQSKAEFLREVIKNEMIKKDEKYKKY